jgi:2-desacetyl-2-hydroxyethyl bacteriochlorophyllide A dehydrogenase
MKAIVKERPGPGFAFREIPRPRVEAGTAIVRVKAVGICGSDVPIFDGVRHVPYPLVPGHEFAGVIVEVGRGVQEWHAGDRVTARLVIGCGKCPYCRQGREMLCDNLQEIGFHLDGAYAEYVRVPIANLHRLEAEVSFREGASVDPVASSYHGLRRLNLRPEDPVVIFGDGPIGLYALQAVRARGVERMLVVGHHDNRLNVATELGATGVNSHQQDPVEAVARFTDGRMADVIVEATGAAGVVSGVLDAAAKGGTILLLGVFHRDAPVNPAPVVRRELQLVGSFCYSRQAFAASLDLIRRRLVDTDPIVTHVLPLEEIGAALELLSRREAIKIILEP